MENKTIASEILRRQVSAGIPLNAVPIIAKYPKFFGVSYGETFRRKRELTSQIST